MVNLLFLRLHQFYEDSLDSKPNYLGRLQILPKVPPPSPLRLLFHGCNKHGQTYHKLPLFHYIAAAVPRRHWKLPCPTTYSSTSQYTWLFKRDTNTMCCIYHTVCHFPSNLTMQLSYLLCNLFYLISGKFMYSTRATKIPTSFLTYDDLLSID